MSEQDIQSKIIPLKSRSKTGLPTIVFESNHGNQDNNVIDLTVVQPKPQSNVIIFSSDNNLRQILDTTQSFIAVEGEVEIPLGNVTDASETIGEVLIEVENIPLPVQSRRKGIIRNARGAIAWQGGDRVLITSINSPTHPITGEPLVPPAQMSNKVLQFPQPLQTKPVEAPASHIGSGNVVSLDEARRTSSFFRPPTEAELKKSA